MRCYVVREENGAFSRGVEDYEPIARESADLLVRVEYTADVAARGEQASFGARLAEQLRKVLGVSANVEPVPPATYERTDFKARRVVDDRDLYGKVYDRASTSRGG